MVGIAELRRNVDLTALKVSQLKAEYEKSLLQLTSEKDAALREYKLAVESSLDIDKLRNAEAILSIRGRVGVSYDKYNPQATPKIGFGDDLSAINAAIKFFASNTCPNSGLNVSYFGCKDYAHWSHQREDCTYGYGPRHGSIVFAIELKKEFRGAALSEEQRGDCIYYLEALKAGKLEVSRSEAA